MSLNPFIIINPHANSGRLGKNLNKVLALTKDYIGDFEYALTEYGQHEIELTKKAIEDGYKTIVAMGGDGTATNTGDVLVGKKDITLGLISGGSMCDWHKTHSIPYDLKSSLEILAAGHTEMLPAIKCSGEKELYAFDMADGGFTAQAAVAAFTELKWVKIGAIKYNYLAVKYVLKFKNTPCTITVDDHEPLYIPDLTNIFVSLGDEIAGFKVFPGNPYFCQQKNDLGIGLVYGMKGLRRITMLVKAIPGNHLGMKGVWFTRGRKITVESAEQPLSWTAEGEIFNENGMKVDMERVDNAVKVIVPEKREYSIEYDDSYYYEDFAESKKERKFKRINK